MKIGKIVTIAVITLFLLQSFTLFNIEDGICSENEYKNNIKAPIVIKVGIVRSGALLRGMSVGMNHFQELGYTWTVGGQTYSFNVSQISDTLKPFYRSDLLNYNKLKQYDVIIISGMQDEQLLGGLPITRNSPAIKLLKKNLERYIEEGGGYVGHCGGSTIPIKSAYGDQPLTWSEAVIEGCSLIDSDIKVYSPSGMYILDEHGYPSRFLPLWKWSFPYTPRPEYMGYLGYLYYAGGTPSGAPVHLNVRDSDHPILRDYLDDNLLVRWGAGPSYIVPFENINISNLLEYPWQEDFYINNFTRINYWSFNESHPFLKTIFATLLDLGLFPLVGKTLKSRSDKYGLSSVNLTDWDYTNIPIKTEHANHSALVALNYPEGDQNGGRIVLCGCHPELPTWDTENNSIIHANDTDDNSLWEPLIKYSHYNNKITDPASWFVRREVAWASGMVPDEHLPPVYGDSQVVDIKPELKESSEFTIDCAIGTEYGTNWNSVNLSLFYRYNGSNSNYTWTDWKYYDSIQDLPWSFTFNATKASGLAHYEFFSLLNTTNESGYYLEFPPPGADAECEVGGSIVANFKYEPGTARFNIPVYFYDESFTSKDTHITQYCWDFGDGNIIIGPNAKTTTHKYTTKGTFTVTYSVKNNLSQIGTVKKNITVLNLPPKADFEPDGIVIRVGQTVKFVDRSSDPDGNIVNWTWDFGDYTTSYEQNPSHTYSKRGYYLVTLEVTDNNGMTHSKYKIDGVVVTILPRSQRLVHPLYENFIEKNINRFPKLQRIVDSNPYLRMLLNL